MLAPTMDPRRIARTKIHRAADGTVTFITPWASTNRQAFEDFFGGPNKVTWNRETQRWVARIDDEKILKRFISLMRYRYTGEIYVVVDQMEEQAAAGEVVVKFHTSWRTLGTTTPAPGFVRKEYAAR